MSKSRKSNVVVDVEVRDRARGVLVGLAVGDALGAQVEFEARDSFPRQTAFVGGGPHRLLPGEWTDDTSMALGLADALNADGKAFHVRAVRNWLDWRHQGRFSCTGTCFDIGSRTTAALRYHGRMMSLLRDDQFLVATRELSAHAGRIPGYAEGNGGLMRAAPVALRFLGCGRTARRIAREQSALTHGPTSDHICEVFVAVLRALILGEHGGLVWRHPEVVSVVDRRRDEVSSAGRAVDTFEAALWAVGRASSFEDAVEEAVDLGDDADTVGAVAGALAGARWGLESIPKRYREVVAWKSRIVEVADRLVEAGLR